MKKNRNDEDRYEIAGIIHSLKGKAIDEEIFKCFMTDVFMMEVKVQHILERTVNYDKYHDIYFHVDGSDFGKLLFCENLFKEFTIQPDLHTPHYSYGSIEFAIAITAIDLYDLRTLKRELQYANEDPSASACSFDNLLKTYHIEFLKENAS